MVSLRLLHLLPAEWAKREYAIGNPRNPSTAWGFRDTVGNPRIEIRINCRLPGCR